MIYANGIKIIPTIFPDGTSQVWKLDKSIFERGYISITWEFESEAEIIHLLQLKRLIDCAGEAWCIELFIPYLPYARQDKQISNETTFALHVFTELLNVFKRVTCFDIHSEHDWIKSISPKKEVLKAVIDSGSKVLVYPDVGALNKYFELFKEFMDSIHAEKVRNQSTGEIEGMTLHGEVKGLKCLIVDDICDGGMTFIKLANLLFENGAAEVNLYVSHGLFTKGIQVLKDAGINQIYTRKGKVQ